MSSELPPQDGFRQHEEEQRRAWLKLTPQERLRWLQQAKEFVRKYLGAAIRASEPR
jgi:hypothetical protein